MVPFASELINSWSLWRSEKILLGIECGLKKKPCKVLLLTEYPKTQCGSNNQSIRTQRVPKQTLFNGFVTLIKLWKYDKIQGFITNFIITIYISSRKGMRKMKLFNTNGKLTKMPKFLKGPMFRVRKCKSRHTKNKFQNWFLCFYTISRALEIARKTK